jgi:Flp pilus assembly protein TadG
MIPAIFSLARRGQCLARHFLRDESGTAAVVIAVALTSVVGIAGLATEGANWYFTSRRMQSAADAAAYSAAISLAANENSTDFTNEGKWVAANSGYNFSSSTGATVTVNNPPSTGAHSSDVNSVEVIIQQTPTRMISSLFLNTAPIIKARAVATMNVNNNGCVLALNRGAVDTTASGGGTINLTNCSMFVNSDDPSGALTLQGSTTINTSGAYVTGGITANGGATLDSGGNTHTGVSPINDPYSDISVPSYTGCDQTNYNDNSNVPVTLGTGGVNGTGTYVFCDGLRMTGQSALNLASNTTYIINGGAFDIGAQATLTGTNVTIVLTGSAGNYATMKINGGATVTLSAPTDTSNPLHGLAVFQDRNAPTGVTNSMEGGANQSITGAIYFPNESLKFAGNSGGGAACTQLVVQSLTFTGSTNVGSNCTGVAIDHFGNATATLTE